MEIEFDYTVWINNLIRLQRLVFTIANSRAIHYDTDNNKGYKEFVASMKLDDITSVYDEIDFNELPKVKEIIEIDMNLFLNDNIKFKEDNSGNNNMILTISTMEGLLTLCYYILNVFADTIDHDYIPNINRKLFVVGKGRGKYIRKSFDNSIELLGFTIPIIKYLQSIKIIPSKAEFPIPYINVIPTLENIYVNKNNINDYEGDDLNDYLSGGDLKVFASSVDGKRNGTIEKVIRNINKHEGMIYYVRGEKYGLSSLDDILNIISNIVTDNEETLSIEN